MITTINNKHKKLNVPNKREQNQTCLDSAEREGLRPKGNVPNLRFPEFQGEWEKCTFDKIAQYKKGPFGSALKKDIFVPQSKDTIKVYEQQNAIKKDWTLSRYYITKGYFNSHMKQFVAKAGDLIVSCAGTIGEIYELPQDAEEGVFNQALMRVQVNDEAVNKEIFITVFSSMIDKFSKIYSNGSAIKNIPPFADLKKTQVFLPCKEEQKKIAKLLALLDERIATQNKIIEDLKKLKSAISKKLLSNDKWTTYKIQDIAEIGRGRVISSVEIDRQKHPLYPVYSSQTSNDGIMGYLDNYMFDGEYITWTTDGANAGTVFYRKGKFNCTNVCGTLKIQPKFDCYFVSLVLQQATQKYVSSNLANPKLMNNTMASIKIRMPNIETQKQLSKVFQTLDSCLLVHQRTCKMYLSEKQYLLRQMLI